MYFTLFGCCENATPFPFNTGNLLLAAVLTVLLLILILLILILTLVLLIILAVLILIVLHDMPP